MKRETIVISSSGQGSPEIKRGNDQDQKIHNKWRQVFMEEPSSSPSAPDTTPRPAASETSAFERWRRQAAEIAGIGLTEDESCQRFERAQHERCEKWKAQL